MIPGSYIGKKVSVDDLIELWKKGNRRQVAKYVISQRKTDAIRIALELAQKTETENAWRLIALMETIHCRSMAKY